MSSELNNILANEELVEQLLEHLKTEKGAEALDAASLKGKDLKSTVESVASGKESVTTVEQEAIIRKFGRPVLYIQDGQVEEPDAPLWKDRIAKARENLQRVIPSIGRIELRGHPRFAWVGTGWMVAPRVVLTNRHVAETFARQQGDGFEFSLDPVGKKIRARIDMFQEHQRANESEFRVQEVLHIEPQSHTGGPDMALLRIAPLDQDDGAHPPPVPLAESDPVDKQIIGAVGYAAWDGVRNDADVMGRIFGGIYDVKRLHPGEIMGVPDGVHYANHDCSTLGGNSGSAIIDFLTGEAVALHYAGRYEGKNYAVKSSAIRAVLAKVGIDLGVGV